MYSIITISPLLEQAKYKRSERHKCSLTAHVSVSTRILRHFPAYKLECSLLVFVLYCVSMNNGQMYSRYQKAQGIHRHESENRLP